MGILTLKNRLTIPTSPNVDAVTLDANADGAVIVKDSTGVERTGFISDLYLKTQDIPAAVANQGSLYGTGDSSPVAIYRDSTGADVPIVVNGGRWQQSAQVQWSHEAAEPYSPPDNPHPTGLFVEPPEGEFVMYTLGAYQISASPDLGVAVGVYGEQNLIFSSDPGTANERFAGAQFNAASGTIFYTEILFDEDDGEIIIYFDASASANPTTIAMWMTLTAYSVYEV